MKVEIQQGAQKPGGIEYPCVMVGRANNIAIATGERAGFTITSEGVVFAYDDTSCKWLYGGYFPATGPVTITLTNE